MGRRAGRVLVLAWEHPPRLFGGLGRAVEGTAAALARRGWDVVVCTPAWDGEEPDHGPVVVRRAAAPPAPLPAEHWVAAVLEAGHALAAEAADAAADAQPDVVHAHDWMVAHAARAVARGAGVPLVATIHATERGRHQGWLPGPLSGWIDAVERDLVAAAAVVTAPSSAHAREVADHLGTAAVAVVPNGVDAEAWRTTTADARRARARWAAAGAHLVAFAGRLEHEKGVEVLLDALAALRGAGIELRAVLAGAGTQEVALRTRAAALGLDAGVVFPGFLDRRDLAGLHRAADAVVVPSLYEPFGLVALEAMAAGAVVVASAVGGLVDVVQHGRTGVTVPPGDPVALADALRGLLADPRRRAVLRDSAAAAAASRWTWDRAAARLEVVYREARATGITPARAARRAGPRTRPRGGAGPPRAASR